MSYRQSKMSRQAEQKRSASYLKPVVEKKTSTTIKETLVNQYTNFAFSFTGGLQRIKSAWKSEPPKQYEGYIYLLGRKFSKKEEALEYFKNVIWFSYRKIPGITKEINSDTSWGCLIRVGQMCMAAALKRHLLLKTKYNEKTINSNIIPAFLDHEDRSCKYSLTKIVETANTMFGIKYGQWFTVSQICSTLDILHSKSPMRGTQDLKTIFYSFSQIFLEDIVGLLEEKLCSCAKKRVACPYCHNLSQKQEENPIQTITYYDKKLEMPKSAIKAPTKYFGSEREQKIHHSQIMKPKSEKHALIFVTCQLSPNKTVSVSKYKQLKELLSLDCSLGIIGGIPRKGLYFLGFDENDDSLLYLDPHYVQEEVELSNMFKMMPTFFSSSFRKCGREDIDPSIGLVFYIENLQSLDRLQAKMDELSEKYEDYILSWEWKNEFAEGMKKVESEEFDADFQDLGGDCDNSFIM